MRLDQFDKLKRLVNRLIDVQRETRFRLVRLQEENSKLKEKLEFYENLPQEARHSDSVNLLVENEKLKEKNLKVKKSLAELVAQIEPHTR